MTSRSYGQYCPVARTLELVGERWTLLLVRELLLGPMRFTDLHAALPGIPRNLLADRLRDLESHGVLEGQELPPPAARTVYALTDAGRTLQPAVTELARWGLTSLDPPAPDESVSPATAVLAGLAAYARPEAASGDAAYRVEMDGRVFALRFVGGGLVIEPPATARPDLTVRVSAATLVRLRLGAESVRGAIAAGRLRFDPDDPLRAGRFLDHFALPVH